MAFFVCLHILLGILVVYNFICNNTCQLYILIGLSFMTVMTVLHCTGSRIGSLTLGIKSSCYLEAFGDRLASSITAGFINLLSFFNNLFPCSNSLFPCLDTDLTDCTL